MRRYTAAIAVALGGVVLLATAPSRAGERPPDLVADQCIERRLERFLEEQRREEARLRVEVSILDDDCGKTIQAVLVETPEGQISAKALAAEHIIVTRQIERVLKESPEASETSLCTRIALVDRLVSSVEDPTLLELTERLKSLRLSPVLEPLLIVHGLQYDIRIESGISEARFSFHAPGYPRPRTESLHPLDQWIGTLRELLGLQCEHEDQQRVQSSGVAEW